MNIIQFVNSSFPSGFPGMLLHFVILMMTVWFIVDRMYFRRSHRRDFYFSFILMSVAIFFLVYFMIFVLEDMKAKTSIGIGIGLFGIFSIMRYRTDAMPVREMTYLFLVISLSVINAIADSTTILELLAVNLLVVGCIWICESRLQQQPVKLVQYDRIDLITPSNRKLLVDDLRQRLGIDVLHVDVGAVDFLRDMAMLRVSYHNPVNDEELERKRKLPANDSVDE